MKERDRLRARWRGRKKRGREEAFEEIRERGKELNRTRNCMEEIPTLGLGSNMMLNKDSRSCTKYLSEASSICCKEKETRKVNDQE